MKVYIALIVYEWNDDDKNTIGDGFAPYYKSLRELQLIHGDIDYIEFELDSFSNPDKIRPNEPFDERGIGLN